MPDGTVEAGGPVGLARFSRHGAADESRRQRWLRNRPSVAAAAARTTTLPATGPVGRSVAKLAAETDDLLDEIDDVLEENAEDFVRAYVQRAASDLALP